MTNMLESSQTYDASSGKITDSIIETDEPSETCCDCGGPVPNIANDGAYVFEKDESKGDNTGVQRCSGCSRAYCNMSRE